MNTGDTAWVLASTALVLLMTPGLAFFYGGLVRRKNALSTIMHSLFCMGIVSVVWVLWGYSLAFGKDVGGFIGDFSYIGLKDVSPIDPGPFSATITHQTFMAFQMMFAVITPALITSAFAERMKFSAFVVFIVAWVTLVYAPLAHWVWGGGWLGLGKLGALDCAGGTVVHINSGVAALAAALMVGKRLRIGREPMWPHNVPFVVLGAGLLWFGWFGFNSGSALASGGAATLAFVATNTASAAAAMTWTALSYIFSGKFSVVGAASGAVAGLVAVTPASGFVGPIPALLIGVGAGVVCYLAVRLRSKLGFDDALDVWAVHGMGGTWGAIATGLFAGVGAMGAFALAEGVTRGEQVFRQLIATGVTWVFSFVMTYAILFIIAKTVGLRVKEESEEQGLDLALHGEEAYRI